MLVQADWFAKHRQQRPAVAAVFFERYPPQDAGQESCAELSA